jgi:DNA-binding Lrp family transcriptional regulator
VPRPVPPVATNEIEEDLSEYYGEEGVDAIILVKVDTQEADDIASTLSGFDRIQHAYLVTGEDDIALKSNFETYKALKEFILTRLAPLEGVQDTKTMMVVTTYKENGEIVE